jgi:hypothetical protein
MYEANVMKVGDLLGPFLFGYEGNICGVKPKKVGCL